MLPTSFGRLKDNLIGQKRVLKLERNRFILPLEEQRKKGPNNLFNYLNSQGTQVLSMNHVTIMRTWNPSGPEPSYILEYRILFEREKDSQHRQTVNDSDRKKEKSKKISRVKA